MSGLTVYDLFLRCSFEAVAKKTAVAHSAPAGVVVDALGIWSAHLSWMTTPAQTQDALTSLRATLDMSVPLGVFAAALCDLLSIRLEHMLAKPLSPSQMEAVRSFSKTQIDFLKTSSSIEDNYLRTVGPYFELLCFLMLENKVAFSQACATLGNRPPALEMLVAEQLLKNGDPSGASQVVERVIDRVGWCVALSNMSFSALIAGGKWEEAHREFDVLLKRLGSAETEDAAQNLEAVASSVEAIPDPIYLFNLSLLLSYSGQFEEALQVVSRALELAETIYQVPFLMRRAKLYETLRQFPSAIQDYTLVTEIEPTHAIAYNNRGVLKKNMADVNGAIEDYTLALEHNRHFALALCNRSVVLSCTGQLEKAIADCRLASDLSHADPDLAIQWGDLCMEAQKYGEAVTAYTRAISIVVRLRSKGGPIRNIYGKRSEAYKALGKEQEAANDLEAYKRLFSCEACPTLDTCQYAMCLDF